MIQKLGALQTYGLKYSPAANRSSPNSVMELVAINSATAFVCEKLESSEDLVVQMKARARTAGLISVLSKLSFCMYVILTVLNVSFKCFYNSSRSSFCAGLFTRVN